MTSSFTRCNHIHAGQFVKSFWQVEGAPAYETETILPKGVIELVFNFGDPVSYNLDLKTVVTPRCFVTGIRSAPVQLVTPRQQSFFGIELQAAAAKKLLGLPAGELLNVITDLEDINTEFTTLWHVLAELHAFEARVNTTQQWIIQKLSAIQERDLSLSGFLNTENLPATVSGLAYEFCYSPRQLHRKSAELFGMSTESLIGYRRYLRSLQLMHHSSETLTRIGYHCNYYDQAHFIREFRDYTGITPGDYRQQKSRLAGHIYQ